MTQIVLDRINGIGRSLIQTISRCFEPETIEQGDEKLAVFQKVPGQ
jgi:hypothetical protein